MVGEGAGWDARHRNEADRDAIIHQRSEQHAAVAARPRDVLKLVGGSFGIGDLRYLAGLRHPKRREIGNRPWECGLQYFIGGRRGWRERFEVSDPIDETEDRARESTDHRCGSSPACLESP